MVGGPWADNWEAPWDKVKSWASGIIQYNHNEKLSDYSNRVVINGKPIIRNIEAMGGEKPGDRILGRMSKYTGRRTSGIVDHKPPMDIDKKYSKSSRMPVIVGFKEGYGEYWENTKDGYRRKVLSLKFKSGPVPIKKEVKIKKPEICAQCGIFFRPSVKNYCYNCGWKLE